MSNTAARSRQRKTGEKYMRALTHVKNACKSCIAGVPCDACTVQPCYSCRKPK